MAKIGKKEFVENIAKELDIPKTEVQAVVDKAIEKIVEEVKKGNEVAFRVYQENCVNPKIVAKIKNKNKGFTHEYFKHRRIQKKIRIRESSNN